MGLETYQERRKFQKTPEPKPKLRRKGESLSFVVQKHAARAVHYDLRLEMGGVLKSWAVPKGPSLNPSVKRLAVMVEDHPLDYRDFEGLIPEGNYGAGGVIIWDRGIYRHPSAGNGKEGERLLDEGLRKGDLKFVLEGEKLRGEFALVKTRQDEKSWLLLKKRDHFATPEEILVRNRSVASGRTLEEISETGRKRPFREKKGALIRLREALEADDLNDVPMKPMPRRIEPMLATLIREPFDHPDWFFEVKWDGYRAIAEVRDAGVSLYSRNGISLSRKFHPILDTLREFAFEAVLDGEIIVANDRGDPDFQMLQDYPKSGKGQLLYRVFDLIHFAGRDLMDLPLVRRKELLKGILPPAPNIKFSDHVVKEGILFFRAAQERGLEGVMAKHSQSTYRPGARSRKWLKVKTQLVQEGVIAGFTQPRGSRRYFGTLVLGVFRRDELIYIGHAGGGFTTRALREIREKLDRLIRKRCPFRVEPKTNAPVTWVKPELVCEVVFHGWTDEGLMRQPVFLRLREDKAARDVVKEGPDPSAPPTWSPTGGDGAEK